MKSFARTISAAIALFCGAAAAQPQPEAPSGWTDKQAVVAAHEMVAAANPLAAQAGPASPPAGGRAPDAAAAAPVVPGLVQPKPPGRRGGLRRPHWAGAAALLSAAVFGALHALTGVSAVPPLIAFGFVLALLYEKTGSIVPGILLHALNNSVALLGQ